tara:strand:- start:1851 stop:2123 length:273 start_codon:yes stop_codon:yes gene_type:complete
MTSGASQKELYRSRPARLETIIFAVPKSATLAITLQFFEEKTQSEMRESRKNGRIACAIFHKDAIPVVFVDRAKKNVWCPQIPAIDRVSN